MEETPIKILENYSEVTGKVPMIPEYGLGFWQCKLRYWNQEQLLQVAPVMEAGQRARKVYLPTGSTWIHIFTEEVLEGFNITGVALRKNR